MLSLRPLRSSAGSPRLFSSIVFLGQCLLFAALCGVLTAGACGQEVAKVDDEEAVETIRIQFDSDGGTVNSIGEVVQEYKDGSLLLLTPDGQLWTVNSADIKSRTEVDEAMVAKTSDEIFEQFQSELPPGFLVHKTRHYVIVYNTSDGYAKFVGELFEKLYRGFYNYWKRSMRTELEEPRFPLVAIVFKDKLSYQKYAEREVGDAAEAMIGYYNMKTNRMVSYDLTGVNGLAPQGMNVSNSAMIEKILMQPQAERTIATIVHEAVHQLSYNSGLQVRLADNPRWLSEGMAMYFESPNPKNPRVWTMGNVNYYNLRQFAKYVPNRGADSLATLIASDDRLLNTQAATAAYPESWALTYFLMRTKKQEYSAYLRDLTELPPLGETSKRERVDLFQKHFGDDLAALDRAFMAFIRKVR